MSIGDRRLPQRFWDKADAAIVAALTEGRLASEDLECDLCQDLYDPACGCQHDGRQWCPSCLINCGQCRDAAYADSWEN